MNLFEIIQANGDKVQIHVPEVCSISDFKKKIQEQEGMIVMSLCLYHCVYIIICVHISIDRNSSKETTIKFSRKAFGGEK